METITVANIQQVHLVVLFSAAVIGIIAIKGVHHIFFDAGGLERVSSKDKRSLRNIAFINKAYSAFLVSGGISLLVTALVSVEISYPG